MSEAEDANASEGAKTNAIVPVKERLVTHNRVAIWDTAELEHMGRVGAIMAESGLASETFFKDGDQPASAKMVVARMVMVANIAREVEADPLMFLQGCSIISRKLHLEGKLVNAIIRKRTGVVLKFRFGAWDTDHIEFPPMVQATDESGEPMMKDGKPVMVPDQTFFNGLGERLAVRCSDPEDLERFVDGSVGLWKTTRAGSPWTSQGNWRRQLRYRGAPEWARAYEPGAVLGLYTEADEDLDSFRDVTPRTSGLMSRLPGAQNGDGFHHDQVNAEIDDKPKRGRPRKAPPEAEGISGTAAGDAGAASPSEPFDPVTGEILDGDDLPEGLRPRPTGTASAQNAASGPASSASATPASTGSAAATSSPTPPDAPFANGPPDEVVALGYPQPGEVYHLNGDEWGEDGRMDTYKDGAPFSTAHWQSGLTIYEDHAPEGPGGAVEESEPELPADFAVYGDAVDAAESWAQIKGAMATFYRTQTFADMAATQQNHIRATTWQAISEAKGAGKMADLPDHAADPSVFRLWIEAQSDVEAIQGTLSILERAPAFTNASGQAQSLLRAAAGARINALKT